MKHKPSTVKVDKVPTFTHPNALHVYTDGSFRPDDNAAYAYLIFSEKAKAVVQMERYACRGKTINQMELQAINKALEHPGDYFIIYSDSMYAISCLTLWHKSWERNNWTTPLGEPVKNVALLQEILAKMKMKKFVRFVKVKAHTGDPFNSLVDFLCANLTYKMRDDPTINDGLYPI